LLTGLLAVGLGALELDVRLARSPSFRAGARRGHAGARYQLGGPAIGAEDQPAGHGHLGLDEQLVGGALLGDRGAAHGGHGIVATGEGRAQPSGSARLAFVDFAAAEPASPGRSVRRVTNRGADGQQA
jgi:hypothetical protein